MPKEQHENVKEKKNEELILFHRESEIESYRWMKPDELTHWTEKSREFRLHCLQLNINRAFENTDLYWPLLTHTTTTENRNDLCMWPKTKYSYCCSLSRSIHIRLII